ncbi:MAG: KH domain-containing protein [Firmicutes bacterium]|nr:KH domain-containing protein [Bacillota bacterium]HOB35211.1 KH domain-containing protein [Bacillota bacterium]HPZ90145.1 KH domain-containing protein [Bacillota bacterium]HQE01091.1 KH domain-containing protein [Bacillota bacterium]
MDELLAYIARSLVDNPDAVKVTKKITSSDITLELSVAPEDVGKVIGKGGKIAKAIRLLVSAAAVNADKKVNVDILG